jgi:multiple sugar transport system permease protein
VTIAWLLVLPALLLRVFTTIYPILETFRISFYDVKLLSGINQFVGFQNYINIFKDSKVLESINFTVIFVVGSMVGHIVLGIILALILNMKIGGRKILRTIVLLPWAMPMIVIAIASKWAFNNDYGLVNNFIRWFHPSFQLDWLIYTETARNAVIAVDLWKDIPFFAILVLAGLQFISSDMYEAKIDGAGAIRSFFKITLPLISKNILVLSIFFTMWRITSFDIVYAMTSGGPGESTALIAYRITAEAFTNLNTGYAASIAVVLFIIMAILSALSMYAAKRVKY